MTNIKKASGNTFLALFAVAALIGILGASLMTFIKGPLKSSISITRQDAAETQMNVAAQSAVTAAMSGANGGDCDTDGMIEPLEFRDGGSLPVPAGGGLLPLSLGNGKKDPWGTEYGYCVWDHGPTSLQTACQGSPGINRRLGGTNSSDYPVIALISAGPDKTFTTTCRSFAAADVVANGVLTDAADLPLISKASVSDDDIILSQTYIESSNSTGGLWSLKATDVSKATINKNLEVTGDGRFSGIGTFQKLTATAGDFLEFISGMKLAGPSVIATCNAGNKGVIRTNASGDGWEICDGVSTWTAIAGDAEEVEIPWPLRAPDGIALLPKYNFAGATNTGMWYETHALRFNSAVAVKLFGNSINFAGTGSNFRVASTGGAKFGNDTGVCAANLNGTIRYNSVSNDYEFCNGSVWANFPTEPVAGSTHTPPPPSGKALVFVTSETYAGDVIGGLTGADDKCQREAIAAKLPGLYRAWLSDTTEGPATRFNKLSVPYQRVDGANVANNWTDLVDGTLIAGINKTATNVTISGDTWTNTSTNGTPAGSSNCMGWTAATGTSVPGSINQTNSTWTSKAATGCSNAKRLYCFQQVADEVGGGWTAACDDYFSTRGLENAQYYNTMNKTAYLAGRLGYPLLEYAQPIGTQPFAGGRTIITACASGTGNPGLSSNNKNTTVATLPVTIASSPYIHVDVPSTGSVTGKVTFGKAVSVNYTVTYQQPGSVIFQTSTRYTGNLGGITGANAKCQARANASTRVPAGTYVALLSTSTQNMKDFPVTYPIVNMNGDLISTGNMFTTSMTAMPQYDEFGRDQYDYEDPSVNYSIFTGANSSGTTVAGYTCGDWTSTTGSVAFGLSGRGNGYWINWGNHGSCGGPNPIYCLQTSQTPPPLPLETKIFATSASFNGNLGGLAGADAKCQAAADAAAPLDKYIWKALISDSTTDASSRVTINYPVMNTNDEVIATANLFGGGMSSKLVQYNEFGQVRTSPLVWTGSTTAGVKTTYHCSNWSNSTSGSSGTSGQVTNQTYWLGRNQISCNTSYGLYCVSQGLKSGGSASTEKKVFVTSNSYTTNLGGLSGADAKCQSSASTAGISGTFKAWLSDNTGSPSTRFTQSTIPYKLLNGTVIANNYSDLVDGTIANPINRTETNAATTSSWAFSNTTAFGTLRDNTWGCSNWSSTDTGLYGAHLGQTAATNANWANSGTDSCGGASVRPLYCFEQ